MTSIERQLARTHPDLVKDFIRLTDLSMDALMGLTFMEHRYGIHHPRTVRLKARFQMADILSNDPNAWPCCELIYRSIDWDASQPKAHNAPQKTDYATSQPQSATSGE